MYVLFGILIGIPAGIAIFFLARHIRHRLLFESLERALLLVKVPHEGEGEGEKKDFKVELNRFEQLLGNLASRKACIVCEAAVPHIGEEVHFYLAVPRTMVEIAAKQIQGLWNGASVEEEKGDYNIFNPQGAIGAAYLLEKEIYALPLRTYREIESDTFLSVAGALTKINEVGEGAALQVLLRPARRDAKKTIRKYLDQLKRGEPAEKLFGRDFLEQLSDIGKALRPEEMEKERRERVVDQDAVKALEAKLGKPLFETNIRIVTSAPSPYQANDILEGVLSGFHQLAAPLRNEFRVIKPKNPQKLLYDFSFRNFSNSQSMILNSEEVASIYHFPTAMMETPRLKVLKAKEAPPPPNLSNQGVMIGRSIFRGQMRDVHVSDEDRRRHVYIVGQTGTGKSTLIANMIADDVKRGKGIAVIDPHGDLALSALGHIPENRREDVIYFDPSDLWKPLGLNMIDYNFDKPEEKTFIVNEMQSIFNKLFAQETMGPMFEQYMRNALLLLMEDMPAEPATLIEVPRVFTDSEYRRRKLSRIKNPVVADFWEKEAVKAGGEASLANMTPYITSKFNNFIANDYMRPIIGQPKSAFNFRQVMDEGKILLVNLSKGRIGDINAGLLGMIFTGKLLMAALSRVDVAQEARRDFHLYIDEFQNFTTDSIATILSEARKYRLNLTIAHQFIAQLEEKIRDAVFGNVGSQIVFRVGVQDAEFLVKQFEPIFSQNDLLSIDNFNAYARLLVHGETVKPFNIKTLPTEPGNREMADSLQGRSREKYGADRQDIEAQIYKRLRE